MTAEPTWEHRFRAPRMSLPWWAIASPHRVAYTGTESGVWQLHATDLAAGRSRRVTDHAVGVIEGYPTPDGGAVVWFEDETGDESGRWWTEPFDGGPRMPLVDGVPHGWNDGIALRDGHVVLAVSDRTGFGVYRSEFGGRAERITHSPEALRISSERLGPAAALSSDGLMVALESGERSGAIHTGVTVIDLRSGDRVGEVFDEGRTVRPEAWSPTPGDARLAITHEREDRERPALWDPVGGDVVDLPVGDLEGDVSVIGWWPDGSSVLLLRSLRGRYDLWRCDPSGDGLARLSVPSGRILRAAVRPDGRVWAEHVDAQHPERILDEAGEVVLAPIGSSVPMSRPYRDWTFDNGQGDVVHGFLVEPPGDRERRPVLMYVHGGPTWLHEDRWEPRVQSYVDLGFVVGMVNYRGSTGYGRAWRDRLIGDIGGPDLHDVMAGLNDLVARGIADPDRAVVGGWSWGGYLTLMALGKHPDRWRCGVAGIPVGDYEMSYDDLSPDLQAYDRALLGGEPKDLPDLMADRNPINHVDAVRAPVIFVVGEHDSRCPYPAAMAYVDRLAARGIPHDVLVFGSGHGSNDMDEEIRQHQAIRAFLRRHVPGLAPD